MFEKIILRQADSGPALTPGELAEALLFYQNIHLVLDYPSLNCLIEGIGMECILALLARPNVSAVYSEQILGTSTDRIGSFDNHKFVAMNVMGSKETVQIKSRIQRMELLLTRQGHEKREARRLAERFRDKVPFRNIGDEYFLPGGIVKAARDDIDDGAFVYEAMRHVLADRIADNNLIRNFRFNVIPLGETFQISTNLDFGSINASRKHRQADADPITEAHLLTDLLMARADTALAAHYGGDFRTSALSSQIIRLRHSELLRRAGIESAELRELKEIVISGYPSIREVIDSKERTFDDFLSLLDKSKRFRNWIQAVNPDEKLVKEYIKDVSAEGWIGSMRSKVIRYVLGSAIGLAASPAVGLAVSAADALMLDKLFAGWRPSHFIEGKLKPFLMPGEHEN